jgi:hypothetical protein
MGEYMISHWSTTFRCILLFVVSLAISLAIPEIHFVNGFLLDARLHDSLLKSVARINEEV